MAFLAFIALSLLVASLAVLGAVVFAPFLLGALLLALTGVLAQRERTPARARTRTQKPRASWERWQEVPPSHESRKE